MIIDYGNCKICVVTPQKCGISSVLGLLAYPIIGEFASKKQTRRKLAEHLLHTGGIGEYQIIQEYKPDFVFGIVRDPNKRFVSAYKDRVLKKNKDNFDNKSFDNLIYQLDNLVTSKTDFGMHIRPQTWWLGQDPTIYDSFYWTYDINNGFKKRLEKILGLKIPDNHRNQSLNLELEIPKKYRNVLENLYKDDYNLISELSQL